ncbi:MAG: hypothetical protein KGI68_08365, partial [Alphaproteobacteria bacterium]|nr:hypothetical protein [Alphaproteobacteria bacterium]
MNTGSAQAAGLFGYSANGGTLRDIGVVGGSVTGGSGVGALAGYAGDILNAFSTATVTGTAGGGDGAGGLVGQSSGTVSNVFATGTVTSSNASVGGLIGTAGGAVSNAFATGTVTATNSDANAGGLVGFNISSITNAYATGFVSVNGANAYAGGLVGQNFGNLTQVYSIGEVENFANLSNAGGSIGQNFAGPFTDAYYDTQYSAAANAIASNSGTGSPTGLSTSALQGSLPGSFSSTVWGTGTGLYPYLKAFYPSGVIAITGTAYTGALALADGLAHTVNAYVDGTAFYTGATLGSQGQYYLPLPSGTLTGSQNLLLVLQGEAANTYIAKASGSTSATLTVGVLAMSSDAASASAMLSGIATAEGSNSSSDFDYSGGSFHNSATVDITSSSATGFALDSVPSGAAGVSVKTTAGDISVTTPFTLSGGSGLSLDSFTSINIDAKVSIAGSGAVTLATDDGGSGGDYSFDLTSNGFAGSLDFGATNNGASLTINGTAYTLLYTLGDLSGINTDSALQLNYALATNLDDANAWTPLGTDGAGNLKNSGNGFSGSFSGLGHTVSNLNVNTGSAQYAGLFGQAIGAIRDIGITGGTVTGGSFSGGLVGFIAAPVSDAFSTVTVSGNSSTGGLVGDTTRAISNAYATGSVTGSGNGVGGLVGVSGSTVSNSYATGAVSGNGRVGGLSGLAGNNVTNSYATGAVTATANSAGGLLGEIDSGSVSNSFAMGSVNGNGYVGGLIGLAFTPVSDTYATGAVHGSSNVGGLIGENAGGAVSNSYWDTLTSGTSTGIARTAGGGSGSATGLTTRQLQGLDTISGSAFSLSSNLGDSTGTTWGGGASGLYPYLKSFFPSTPQAITGTAYNTGGGSVLVGGSVTALIGGATVGTASTGANGYYYVLAPSGTISGSAAVLAYENGVGGGARVDSATSAGNISDFDIWGSTLIAPTTASTYSSAAANTLQIQDATLIGNAVGSNTAVSNLVAGLTSNYGYIASGDFTIDQTLTLSNGLYVQSAGNITVANALTLPSSNGLVLDASDTLTISASVDIPGAGRVDLTTGFDTTTAPGFSIAKLSFDTGDSIDYTGGSGSGASLAINGTSYTLLYSMTDVGAINGDGTNDATTNTTLQGHYALATSLDATGTTGWQPVGTDASSTILNSGGGFSGTFEGLNHTISNLNVDLGVAGGANYAGLFGYAGGTLRDITLTGGSARGSAGVGLLAGVSSGIVTNASGSGSVTGVTQAGGLIRVAGGAVINASSSGSVTSFGPGGGLIGESGAAV